MATGCKGGGQRSSMSRVTKQLIGGSLPLLVGGGLVFGIATVVVVRVAGKLLSKFRKPSRSTTTPFFTPNNSLDTIVNEENVELLNHLKAQLPNEAAINGKRVSSLDLQKGGSDHNDTNSTHDGENYSDWTSIELYPESSPANIINNNSSPDLHSGSACITQEGIEADEFSTANRALSELVTQALLDANHDSSSKHELLNKSKALQDGIAGVISRAREDLSGCGETSNTELTPTMVKLMVSWETTSSSGSEKEASQAHPGELHAEQEVVLQPDSMKTEADKQIIESINHDRSTSQPEKVSCCIALHSSSPQFEEQEEEPEGTTTGSNEAERGEQPLEQEEASIPSSSESANPK